MLYLSFLFVDFLIHLATTDTITNITKTVPMPMRQIRSKSILSQSIPIPKRLIINAPMPKNMRVITNSAIPSDKASLLFFFSFFIYYFLSRSTIVFTWVKSTKGIFFTRKSRRKALKCYRSQCRIFASNDLPDKPHTLCHSTATAYLFHKCVLQ